MARDRVAPAAAAGERRPQEIAALLSIFAGVALLLCLLWPQHAPLPDLASAGLRAAAGTGAFAVPLLLLFVGAMALRGYRRITFTHATAGSLVLFLVFVTGRHIAGVPDAAHFDTSQAMGAGGWLGGLAGACLVLLLGRPITYLALITGAAIGLVLVIDQPVAEMLDRAASAARARRRPRKQPAPRALEPAAAKKSLTPAALPAARAERDGGAVARLFNRVRHQQDGVAAEPRHEPRLAAAPASAAPESTPAEARAAPPAGVKQPAATNDYTLPPLTLLRAAPAGASNRSSSAEQAGKIAIIEQTLEQFNIGARVVEVASGPSVTRYEIQLAPGIKVNKIVSLADNLTMSLAAIDVRVEAPIPGKSAIGVEVPNSAPLLVPLRECLETDEFLQAPSRLTIALGKDVAGLFRYADLCKMPHLLIGGATNSGKSVCLNALIASLVYRATPREVKLLMIDPKRVELSLWDGIPHLMHPVVKDVKQAAGLFRAALREMDRRYDLFAAMSARNIESYNERVPESERLPFIVLIVDELADLMMQQGPEIETSICRLAQLARATGIHLVIATQRPSVDIITGTIKANISSRIAFAVASQVDSRTILDMTGADRLIGRGDMLFMPIDASKPQRIQGCYLSEAETHAIVEYLRGQEQPSFDFTLGEAEAVSSDRVGRPDDDVDDKLFEQAVRLVVNNGQASTSMLQRRFRIGYTRAARIVEMMEERGIVGPLNGARPREILVSRDGVEQMFRPGGPIPSVEEYQEEA